MRVSADARRVAAELRPALRPVDLSGRSTVHIVGVAGTGMRAIARVLLGMGHRVTGSDGAPSPELDALRALGADVYQGHDPARASAADRRARR